MSFLRPRSLLRAREVKKFISSGVIIFSFPIFSLFLLLHSPPPLLSPTHRPSLSPPPAMPAHLHPSEIELSYWPSRQRSNGSRSGNPRAAPAGPLRAAAHGRVVAAAPPPAPPQAKDRKEQGWTGPSTHAAESAFQVRSRPSRPFDFTRSRPPAEPYVSIPLGPSLPFSASPRFALESFLRLESSCTRI